MPSSLIIVALAVAWLVVLVPMVARKRQEVARTGDDALASRVVRSGSAYDDEREESVMAEPIDDHTEVDDAMDAEVEEVPADEYAEAEEPGERPAGRYRPGRGGFDPQAAELAARAKYAFRQRVVVALLATVLISVVLATVLWSPLWWLTGLAGATLAGYLGYLRRQVRIENEIRQRRLARMAGARLEARRRGVDEPLDGEYDLDAEYDYELADEEPRTLAGVERKPRPQPRRPRRNAVVVDLDDEDPAFHELDEPGPPAFRRAVGE